MSARPSETIPSGSSEQALAKYEEIAVVDL